MEKSTSQTTFLLLLKSYIFFRGKKGYMSSTYVKEKYFVNLCVRVRACVLMFVLAFYFHGEGWVSCISMRINNFIFFLNYYMSTKSNWNWTLLVHIKQNLKFESCEWKKWLEKTNFTKGDKLSFMTKINNPHNNNGG